MGFSGEGPSGAPMVLFSANVGSIQTNQDWQSCAFSNIGLDVVFGELLVSSSLDLSRTVVDHIPRAGELLLRVPRDASGPSLSRKILPVFTAVSFPPKGLFSPGFRLPPIGRP